jgi:oligoribonuclease
MTTNTKSALNLVWCDLEVARTSILQAALLITTPELVPVAAPGLGDGGLMHLVRITAAQAAEASEWVRGNQGDLLATCQSDPAALPVEEVERRMLAYLESACVVPSDGAATPAEADRLRRENPALAGNSVHKDYAVLERWMPTFVSKLTYRLVDVSALKELRRRWSPDLPAFDKQSMARDWLPDLALDGAEHDALYDIKCSLAELRFYRATMFA